VRQGLGPSWLAKMRVSRAVWGEPSSPRIATGCGARCPELPRVSRRPRLFEGWGLWEPGHRGRRTRAGGADGAGTRGRARDAIRGGAAEVAGKVGCHRETLRRWLRQAERDGGIRPGPTTEGSVRSSVYSAAGPVA
jgi:hypothetical protein